MIPRRMVPGMRWWCTPAVELRDEMCRDCFNTAIDPVSRLCGSCAERHQRWMTAALLRIGELPR